MGKNYKVIVHGVRGEKLLIELCNTEEQMKCVTVLQLKEKIAQRLPDTAVAVKLIFTDQFLDEDSSLLWEYGVRHMSVIYAVLKLPGGRSRDGGSGDGSMGDRDKSQSMEKLTNL